MKKIISLLLALALCLALAAPVFAEDISGNDYATEAKAAFEKGFRLAAAVAYEFAAQAYEKTGAMDAARGALSSAGDAYAGAGKTQQAIRVYLAAKDYEKIKKLFLDDADKFSGDDYIKAAAAAAEQGVPEKELTDLYEKALAAYLTETKTGDEWIAVAEKLAEQEKPKIPEFVVSGLYGKAVDVYLTEMKTGDEWIAIAEKLAKQGIEETKLADFYEKALAAYQTETKTGDEWIAAAAKLAEQGVPESVVAGLYKKALESYMTETKTGDEWVQCAEKLAGLGFGEDELKGIYEKAARAYAAESEEAAKEDAEEALTLISKADALAAKHGNDDLAKEIHSAWEIAKEKAEIAEIADAFLEIAEKSKDDFKPFMFDFAQAVKEYFPNLAQTPGESGEDELKAKKVYSLAGDLCVEEELYWHAFQFYSQAYALYGKTGDLKEDAATVLGKWSKIREDAVKNALTVSDMTCAQDMAEVWQMIFLEYSDDYELALEWAATFDEQKIPCGDGESWTALVQMLKAQHEAKNTNSNGSAFSEGNVAIFVGVGCLVVGFLAAMFIFKKKKQPADVTEE